MWIQCGHLLSQKFSEFLPQNQESFASNFLQFKQSVKELDHWGKALVGGLPETSRILITSHDAFRYFGRHFDIRVVALQGINTIAEAGLADRTNLVDFIRKHHSPALFVESSVNPKHSKKLPVKPVLLSEEPSFLMPWDQTPSLPKDPREKTSPPPLGKE